jgi:hypothetical protein
LLPEKDIVNHEFLTKVVIDLNQIDVKGRTFTRMSNAEKPVMVGEKVIAYESEEGTAFSAVVDEIKPISSTENQMIYLMIDALSVFNLYTK